MAQMDPRKRTLTRWLIGVFVLALVMGPGPGIYLINPDPSSEGPTATVLGMPIVYVWAVFWAAVMGAAVVVAYAKLWTSEEKA